MKKTPMRKSGFKKKGKEPMPQELKDRLPKYCEIQSGVCDGKFIAPAHRHNRALYKKTYRGQLWAYKQVISGCQKCHEWLDRNKEVRENVFIEQRGYE